MNRAMTRCDLASRLALIVVFFAVAPLCQGQEARQWTERENLGFKGPVRSVLTAVVRPNPDPRPKTRHKLFVDGAPGQFLTLKVGGSNSPRLPVVMSLRHSPSVRLRPMGPRPAMTARGSTKNR